MSRLLLLFIIALYVFLCIELERRGVSRIILFVILGMVVGFYYGYFNNDIFHKSGKFNNEFEKVHTLWIHVVCGLIGALCLFILYNKVFVISVSAKELGIGDFAILLVGLLGIVGLLPRTFWFLANNGSLFGTGKN